MRTGVRAIRAAMVPLMLAVGALGAGVSIGVAEAQDLAAARPRFLVARGGRQAPVEVAVSRVPLLRRTVSLTLHDEPLPEALKALKRAAGITFVYSPGVVNSAKRVTLRTENMTVGAILTDLLLDAGVDVLVSGEMHITLVPRQRRPDTAPQPGVLVGRVTDAKTGEGLGSVDVFLAETQWRTSTDTGGRYRLDGVDSGTYTLTARRLGFTKQSRQVKVRAEQQDTVDFALSSVAVALDELVTTATGQQRRRDLGNAITTIRADSVMQTAPIRSLTDLLDNRVPGMTLQHSSGAPGDPARVRLRGLSSVRGSNDPVVVVDGVRIYAAQADARSGNLASAIKGGTLPAPSPLDQIDPNIIEKIEIFKGPSAATLYGADAANGVIVITTKKGHPGPTRWSARVEHGRTDSPGRWPEGYYAWGHSLTDNSPRLCVLLDHTCQIDSVVRHQVLNDPDLTILGQGRRAALTFGASGGTQALTYSVTGSYSDETGLLQLPAFEVERFRTIFNRAAPDWMRRPHQFTTWSVTSSATARLSPTLDLTLATTLGRSEQQRSDLEGQARVLASTYVDQLNGIYYTPSNAPICNSTGTCRGLATSSTLFRTGSGEDYYTRASASAVNFTTGLNANWRPLAWFTASGQAGVNLIAREDQTSRPAGLVSVADSGQFALGTGRSLVGTVNLQGTLRKPLGWGGFTFETSLGANLNTTHTTDLANSATNLVPGSSTITGARTIRATEARLNTSVFGWYLEPRLMGERLSFSAGLRIDGGSAYGARVSSSSGGGLKLPKLGASWVISEEPFFPFKALFSSLRLRGAYGQAQVQPGPADRLRLYSQAPDGTLRLTDRLGNTELRPERSKEFEGGIDADLLGSRLSVELTAYHKTKVDALMAMTLPPSVHGGGTVVRNIGNIRNTGVELTLGLTPVQSPLVTWSTQLFYSRNHNTLVKLGRGVLSNKTDGLVEGYPLGGRWARPILGYEDQNANGVIDFEEVQVADSFVFMGRSLPEHVTGLHSNLVLFGGVVGITAGFRYESGATQRNLAEQWVLVRGLTDPSASFGDQAAAVASFPVKGTRLTEYGTIQDVSIFRFNSLSVSYRAPARVARLLRARQLRVALQGDNLGLHSTYRGKDPDVGAFQLGSMPSQDGGQLPQPRTWQLAFALDY